MPEHGCGRELVDVLARFRLEDGDSVLDHFCTRCGKKIVTSCDGTKDGIKCKARVEYDELYCGSCGAKTTFDRTETPSGSKTGWLSSLRLMLTRSRVRPQNLEELWRRDWDYSLAHAEATGSADIENKRLEYAQAGEVFRHYHLAQFTVASILLTGAIGLLVFPATQEQPSTLTILGHSFDYSLSLIMPFVASILLACLWYLAEGRLNHYKHWAFARLVELEAFFRIHVFLDFERYNRAQELNPLAIREHILRNRYVRIGAILIILLGAWGFRIFVIHR